MKAAAAAVLPLSHPQQQYVFIHDVLTEAILGKKTEVVAEQLRSYYSKITTPGRNSRTRLETQFKVKGPLMTKQTCTRKFRKIDLSNISSRYLLFKVKQTAVYISVGELA